MVTANAPQRTPHTAVFVYDARPGAGGGTISGKTYEANTTPANKRLTAFASDADSIIIDVELHVLGFPWQPDQVELFLDGVSTGVTVSKQNYVSSGDRVFTAALAYAGGDTTGVFTVHTGDGATSADVSYTRLLDPPEILSAAWDGTYPTSPETGLQTAVKSGDVVTLTGTVDTHATRIRVESFGATSSQQDFDDDYSSGTFSIDVTIGSSTGTKQFRMKANKDGGTYGATFDTTDAPAIVLDQASHSYDSVLSNQDFSAQDATNFALATGHQMTGDMNISNWNGSDVILYTSSEVDIRDVTSGLVDDATFEETKRYDYVAGTYRDSGTNVTITSRRKANGKQSTKKYLVKIANVAPELTVVITGNPDRLRSKTGADKTYTVTLQSNQELKATPTLERDNTAPIDDGPNLPALSGSAPDKTWTATMTIQEDDAKNLAAAVYDWSTIAGTNGAGTTTNTLEDAPAWQGNGSSQYTVGGFESRDIAMAQFDEFNPIGTQVSNLNNAAKLSCEAVGIGVLAYKTNTTQNDGGREFTVVDSGGNFDADGDHVRCTDGDIFNNQAYTLRTEEAE